MKKIIIILLVVILSFLINGCTHQGGSSDVTYSNNNYDLKYEKIKVEETHIFEVNMDDYLKVSINTKKEKLKITIKDSIGNEIYTGSNLSTSEFDVKVIKDDTYTIKIYGPKGTGNLTIDLIRNK